MNTQSETSPQKGDVMLLVGTMKGAFVLRSDESRRKWKVDGPHFRGFAIYALLHDARNGRNKTFAAANNTFIGSSLRTSEDGGRTWTDPERYPIKFPEDSGRALKQIWQVIPGRANEPDTLYCGVEPAALFESRDGGETWEPNRGLLNHEHQPSWQPGAGGLCLHTISSGPERPEADVDRHIGCGCVSHG